EVGKLRRELKRVGRGVDDLGVLLVDGQVRRILAGFGTRGCLIGLIGCAVVAGPVSGRGADFGNQVGDTDCPDGVASALIGVAFLVLYRRLGLPSMGAVIL